MPGSPLQFTNAVAAPTYILGKDTPESWSKARHEPAPWATLVGKQVILHIRTSELKKLTDPKPLSCAIAAISVGVVDGRVRVDLPYEEDSRAEVDMNVVATDTGTLVEIQGTGEGATFPRKTLDKMLDAALAACDELFAAQREALALPYPGELPEGPPPKTSFGS